MKTRRFAWNGISFQVPEGWELSSHRSYKGVHTIEMEDDVALRLEMEWARMASAVDPNTVRERFSKNSKAISAEAEDAKQMGGLPPGWTAFRYTLPGKYGLFAAYYIPDDRRTFCFFKFHFETGDTRNTESALREVASSVTLHPSGVIPWSFYDVHFQLDADFSLAGSSLQAGNKLMIFQWRLCPLYIWHFSLADMILRDHKLEEWLLQFILKFKRLKGPVFFKQPGGGIGARRGLRYPVGHFEEIGRLCFRYHVGYKHLADRNQIVLWVFNYRLNGDLQKFKQGFIPGCPLE